jgi:DNA recombination protein RmuC
MDYLPYIILVLFFLFLLLALFLIRSWIKSIHKSTSVSDELISWLKEHNMSQRSADENYKRNMELFNQRLDKAAETMMHVQKAIGEFSEIGRSMKNLNEFLQSPKLRGNIGEQVLRELLSQSLPHEAFVLQYQFLSGERVDAVVKTTQGLIAIDSKFPISAFRLMSDAENEALKDMKRRDFVRDVKKHIASISKKYILPTEGTMDYALMYIPAESIYYEIINNAELYDFATESRIIPVSPMSFYAYLKVILVSLEGQRIHTEVRSIMQSLQGMRNDFSKVDNAMSLLHKHINHAYVQSGNVVEEVARLGRKIDSTAQLNNKAEKKLL